MMFTTRPMVPSWSLAFSVVLAKLAAFAVEQGAGQIDPFE